MAQKKRILLVEDDKSVRTSVALFLGGKYEVTPVSSRESAYGLLGGGAKFDLIITNLGVVGRGISGTDFIRMARENQLISPNTKVAVISGRDWPLKETPKEFGVVFLAKPLLDLDTTIAEILEERLAPA